MSVHTVAAELALVDWKRQVFAGYRAVREADDPTAAWRGWRALRDRLFAEHPQSPYDEAARARFESLAFFDYDPRFRVAGEVEPAAPELRELEASSSSCRCTGWRATAAACSCPSPTPPAGARPTAAGATCWTR